MSSQSKLIQAAPPPLCTANVILAVLDSALRVGTWSPYFKNQRILLKIKKNVIRLSLVCELSGYRSCNNLTCPSINVRLIGHSLIFDIPEVNTPKVLTGVW